ncbi:MAG: hypothetical protein ABW318_20730 [Vicinamibacterales bacterium]
MSLLGKAALTMWWDMAPAMRADFEDWHSHEHFPERLGVPGFRRASRWTSATGGEGIFVMYELDAYEILSSPHYLARLNDPTPWSTRMMPHHRNMVRGQCRVVESTGGGVARQAVAVRLSPTAGREEKLRSNLKSLFEQLCTRPGLVGAHLLKHETPSIAKTKEQQIRGAADQVADWVLVAIGYDPVVVKQLAETELSADSLIAAGGMPGQTSGLYSLSHSATPADVVLG